LLYLIGINKISIHVVQIYGTFFLMLSFVPLEIPEHKSNTSTNESEGSMDQEINRAMSDRKG
jgi:hypothetical protein